MPLDSSNNVCHGLFIVVFLTRHMAGRPQANPNYGFIKQLDIFEKCGYEPSPSHSLYRSWKRRHVQDINSYLSHLIDTVAIIPDKLLMARFVSKPPVIHSAPLIHLCFSEFPDDPEQAQSLLLEMGVTHLMSISPAQNSFNFTFVTNHHVSVSSQCPEALFPVLPNICDYIRDAVKNGGLVLVHCRIESRACMAVCAYRKFFFSLDIRKNFDFLLLFCSVISGGSSYEHAFCVIQNGQFFSSSLLVVL